MATPIPSLRWLQGFEAVARHGNVTRAAEALFISQSAVSHQIAQLESQLGQPLFRRVGRGMELTMAGEHLLETVSKALDHIRWGLGRLETYLDAQLLTIVCPADVAQGWLQPRLDALQEAHPTLCPVVSVDETARYVDQVDVDIVMGRSPLQQVDVAERILFEDALVAVHSPAMAPPMGASKGQGRLLCLEVDAMSPTLGPTLKQHFDGWARRGLFDDARLLLDAALRGRGVAVLSRVLAEEALAQGRLHLWSDFAPVPRGPVWLAWAQQPRSALIEQVVAHLLSETP